MRLRDILPQRPVARIMVRTNYPEQLEDELTEKEISDGMLFGYCAWDGEKLISLDGDSYSLNEIVVRYEWEDDGTLTYWTHAEYI